MSMISASPSMVSSTMRGRFTRYRSTASSWHPRGCAPASRSLTVGVRGRRYPSSVDAPDPLDLFSPAVRAWFSTSFPEATAAQAQGWPAIAGGDHTLILAPTGSGKTLSAFLWAIDRLVTRPAPTERTHRTRLLYVSPL